MAEDLRKEFDVDAKLVAGKKGIFDVVVDGEILFSKSKSGRFPDAEEISRKIRE